MAVRTTNGQSFFTLVTDLADRRENVRTGKLVDGVVQYRDGLVRFALTIECLGKPHNVARPIGVVDQDAAKQCFRVAKGTAFERGVSMIAHRVDHRTGYVILHELRIVGKCVLCR